MNFSDAVEKPDQRTIVRASNEGNQVATEVLFSELNLGMIDRQVSEIGWQFSGVTSISDQEMPLGTIIREELVIDCVDQAGDERG